MKKYVATVTSTGFTFDIDNVEDEQQARSTAVEYLEIVGMPEWEKDLVIEENTK